MDLCKCFDVIDHSKLLSKLQASSIDPTWFSSYLRGHTQSVCTTDGRGNRLLSNPLHNPISVLQGSSLGPLLFQIFLPTTSLSLSLGRTWYSALMIPKFYSLAKKTPSAQLIATMEHFLESFDAWFHSHVLKSHRQN